MNKFKFLESIDVYNIIIKHAHEYIVYMSAANAFYRSGGCSARRNRFPAAGDCWTPATRGRVQLVITKFFDVSVSESIEECIDFSIFFLFFFYCSFSESHFWIDGFTIYCIYS